MQGKLYHRVAFWIIVVYVVFLSVWVGLYYYGVWTGTEPTLSEFFSDKLVDTPIKISIISTLPGLLPELGFYTLVVSIVLLRDFYLKARAKKGGSLFFSSLLFSPLFLWVSVFFMSWSSLVWQLRDDKVITYMHKGELRTFCMLAMPPLWLVSVITFLFVFPLLLRALPDILTSLRAIRDNGRPITSLRNHIQLSRKKIALGLIVVMIAALGYLLCVKLSDNHLEKNALPVHRISTDLQQLDLDMDDLNRSYYRYIADRKREVLQYAEEHEYPEFPYLITAIWSKDRGVEQGYFSLRWSDTTRALKAIEIKHDSMEGIIAPLEHMGGIYGELAEPGAAPLRSGRIWPVTFGKTVTSPQYRRVEGKDYYILEIPAELPVDKWELRVINEKGEKSNWIPLYIR